MLDVGLIEAYQKIGYTGDISVWDFNGDGDITAVDCPWDHGSLKAKDWWLDVLIPHVKAQVTPELQAQYPGIEGVYKGKPLIPGEAGPGQGDFDLLKDRFRIIDGLEEVEARRLTGWIKYQKYGG